MEMRYGKVTRRYVLRHSNLQSISLLYRAILNIILNIQLIAQCFIIKIH